MAEIDPVYTYRRPRRIMRRALAIALASISLVGACSGDDKDEYEGGCDPFRVYAQNRWDPLGTAIRDEPDVLSEKVGSFAPNEVIAVSGWLATGESVYPTNSPPWDSDVWFRLEHEDGWVNFAAVRGEPTEPDPTLRGDGGQPANTPEECELRHAA